MATFTETETETRGNEPATAALTRGKNAALIKHMATVRKQLDALATQEQAAQAAHAQAQQALQVETNPQKRITLKADQALALEGLASVEIARCSVEQDYSHLSRDVAQNIVGWLDFEAYPALEADVAKHQTELTASQARFDEAYATLRTARNLHAQAQSLCQAVDSNFEGISATNNPQWAANGVADMQPTLASLHEHVAALTK